jgi:hypothetical protein
MRRLRSILTMGLLLVGAALFAQGEGPIERPKLYSMVIQGVV